MKKIIPDNAFYSAEVRLNGTAIPGYSTWQGEIDIASLSCAENPELPFHVSSVQALLDDVDGLGVTLQAKSHLVEPKPRHNIIRRVWLTVTNLTAAPISFEDKRLVFFGRGAAAGFELPRHAIPPMEPTTGTPFELLDLDGMIQDTAFINVTNEGAGTGDMQRAIYDSDNDGTVDNASALGGQVPTYFAVDSATAHLAGSETISGRKTLATELVLTEIVTPSSPSPTLHGIYPKADGKLYHLNSAGVEELLGAGGGDGGTGGTLFLYLNYR